MNENIGPIEAQTPGEEAAAAGQTGAAAERLTWQQIMADPEYRACYEKAVQAIVQRRLKNRGDAEAQLRELSLAAAEKSREDMQRVFSHLDSLLEQAQQLMAEQPDFELMAALEDERLLRLTAPHSGVSLSDAYYALHREEIGKRAARESLEKLSRSILSGAARPRESLSGPAGYAPGPGSMSKAERELLKKRIYAAGVMGEKVYPFV
jgi:hypothetical protein